MSNPNIFLFITDQQRADTIGELGHAHVETPTLDRLVREGVTFENCFCTSPSCAPSRASFFLADWPHNTRVFQNNDHWTRTWVERFQNAGYHTVNVGKMHTHPMDTPAGFDQRFVVENKDRPLRLDRPHGNFYDEWDRFLNGNGVRKPSRHNYRAEHPDWEKGLGAFTWPLEERYHPDVFVGRTARWFIEQRQSTAPFFLEVGFPGPHPPYDPPARYLEMYRDVPMPIEPPTEEELAGQTPPQKAYRREAIEGNHDAVRWHERPTREMLQRLWRHYMANVTLIDSEIDATLAALEARGYLEDAIVVFMSDHGDALGEHGHIQKWTMYDCVTRVPAVVWAPKYLPTGRRVTGLIQHFDLVPMLFELAGLDPPPGPAESVLPLAGESDAGRDGAAGIVGREMVFSSHIRDQLLREVRETVMVRTTAWKLVHYLDQPWGELYDLTADPGETRNLWSSAEPAHTARKTELLAALRDWRLRTTIPASALG